MGENESSEEDGRYAEDVNKNVVLVGVVSSLRESKREEMNNSDVGRAKVVQEQRSALT